MVWPAATSTVRSSTVSPSRVHRRPTVWAVVDVMVARTVNASPSLTWLGASTRETAMSAPPRASTGWTSTRMPCSRSRLASVAASPSVARPSDTTTIRRRASDGRTAPARRRAPARLVREASTLVAGWTSSASSWTVSSRRASPPKKATPARAPSGWWRRASRTQSTAAACPPTPSESDPSTRNITATRLDVRGMARPARAPMRRRAMPARRATAARHWLRLTPLRRRLRRSSTARTARRAITNHLSHGRSPVARRSPGPRARSGTGRLSAGAMADSPGSALTAKVTSGRPSWRTVQ